MDQTSIRTISGSSEGFYKDRSSKFFAYAFPVQSDDAIKGYLQELKITHAKARHHCYAYRLLKAEVVEYANDAGEPSGSAGLPILNALRSNEVCNALVVVVRYFGGSKLGIPGLIQAYKEATIDALEQNNIIQKELTIDVNVQLAYEQVDQLYKMIGRFNAQIIHQKIDGKSEFELRIPLKFEDEFLQAAIDGMTIRIKSI